MKGKRHTANHLSWALAGRGGGPAPRGGWTGPSSPVGVSRAAVGGPGMSPGREALPGSPLPGPARPLRVRQALLGAPGLGIGCPFSLECLPLPSLANFYSPLKTLPRGCHFIPSSSGHSLSVWAGHGGEGLWCGLYYRTEGLCPPSPSSYVEFLIPSVVAVAVGGEPLGGD